MDAGPDLLTLEQIGMYSAMCQRGEITDEKLTYYKHHACPSCGACSFMGTASTMQIMAEALGLMLPGSALMPATCEDLKEIQPEGLSDANDRGIAPKHLRHFHPIYYIKVLYIPLNRGQNLEIICSDQNSYTRSPNSNCNLTKVFDRMQKDVHLDH